MKEFERLGAPEKFQQIKIDPNCKIDYCDFVYVPKGVDLQSLEGSAECRNKFKPLALSFIYKGRNLWRSSELKTSCDPEKLADDILLLQKTVSTEERLMIYSARENNIDTSKQGNES